MTVYDQSQPNANRVFISYSSIDRIRTNGLGLLLEAMGHRVFHDHRTIKPGWRWEAALQEGLDEADVLMVFWTKHAARSDWVRKEYEYFYSTYPDRLLVPVLADETPLTDILKTRQHTDFAPVVNEVLETKHKMKKEGAGARAIEEAVLKRLAEAGVEIKTKKHRRMLFLFLGFGWLLSLLRYPASAVGKLGRAGVEKTAQLTAGQVTAIGAAAALGLAAGVPVAENLGPPDTTEAPRTIEPPDTIEAARGNLPEEIWGDSLSDFRSGFVDSRNEVNQRLAEIYTRLDELIVGWTDELVQCRQELLVLREGRAAMPVPQAAPSDLAAAAVSSDRIRLTWADNSGTEQGFEVERCQGSGCNDFAKVADTAPNAISYVDTGLDQAATYRYRVRAFNTDGVSGYSDDVEIVTMSPPLEPPANLVATVAGLGQIDLTWEDRSGNEEGFEIARCQGSDCTDFAKIAETGPNATSFSDAGLNMDARYRVRGFSAGGFSDYSNDAQTVVILEGDVLPEWANQQHVLRIVKSHMQGQTRGGSVVLVVRIDEEGRVRPDIEPTVAASSGNPELLEAALTAVKEARFEPAEKAGQKLAVWVKVAITFVAPD